MITEDCFDEQIPVSDKKRQNDIMYCGSEWATLFTSYSGEFAELNKFLVYCAVMTKLHEFFVSGNLIEDVSMKDMRDKG